MSSTVLNGIEWDRLQQLFHAAADLPPTDRHELLSRECGDNTTLRRQVESLLRVDSPDHDITAVIRDAADQVLSDAEMCAGARIGPYRIIRLLGKGGMGSVFLAERSDGHFSKHVALKTIRLSEQTPEVRSRFKTERQILATLEHPNVARLLDGGSTDDDSPFVVMEYIEGVPLDEYCRRHQLSVRARLALFSSVCNAVQHAHRNLVIHRDLKPSNILVTPDGEVKLLDFGIGKLLDTRHALHTVPMTRAADRLMTPEYASPEQVRGDGVSTATDIYSLGVVLYELLAERRPFALETGTLSEAERIICEREPEPVSRWNLQSDRDLDNIVAMAMRKEPERRYGTVAQLAEDLQRWQDHLPVAARANTWRYRAAKFARRNRWLVAGAVAAATLITSFSAGMAILAREAKQEAENSRAVADFLVSVFQNAAPDQARGRTVTARELLDTGSKRVATELKGRPVVQGTLLSAIGNVYLDLGLYDEAGPLLTNAVSILGEHRGEHNLDTAAAVHALAGWHSERGEFAKAEELNRKVLTIRENLLGADDLSLASVWSNLGMCLFRLGRFPEAEQAHRNSLRIKRLHLTDGDASLQTSRNNLAIALFRQGKFAEAEPIMRDNVELRVRTLGEQHPSTAASLHNYSFVLGQLGRYREQEEAARRSLAIRTVVLGDAHPDTAYSLNSLSQIMLRRGAMDEAVRYAKAALSIRERRLKPGSVEIALAQQALAGVLLEHGDVVEAARLIESSAPVLATGTEASSGSVEEQRGLLSWAQRDFRRAEVSLAVAIAKKKQAGASAESELPGVIALRADLLRAAGRLAEAREAAMDALEKAEKRFPPGHAEIANATAIAGATLCAAGDKEKGRSLLEKAISTRKNYAVPGSKPLRHAEADLVLCRTGDPQMAIQAAGPYATHWRLHYLAQPRQ